MNINETLANIPTTEMQAAPVKKKDMSSEASQHTAKTFKKELNKANAPKQNAAESNAAQQAAGKNDDTLRDVLKALATDVSQDIEEAPLEVLAGAIEPELRAEAEDVLLVGLVENQLENVPSADVHSIALDPLYLNVYAQREIVTDAALPTDGFSLSTEKIAVSSLQLELARDGGKDQDLSQEASLDTSELAAIIEESADQKGIALPEELETLVKNVSPDALTKKSSKTEAVLEPVELELAPVGDVQEAGGEQGLSQEQDGSTEQPRPEVATPTVAVEAVGASSEAAPVSISQTGVTPANVVTALPDAKVDPGNPLLMAQVSDGIEAAYESTSKTMQIQLNPEDLGSMRIQIKQMGEGSVAARLIVDQPEAAAKMKQSLADLQNNLERAGLRVERIEIVQAGADAQGAKDSSEESFQSFDMNQEDSAFEQTQQNAQDNAAFAEQFSEFVGGSAEASDALSELDVMRQAYERYKTAANRTNPATAPAIPQGQFNPTNPTGRVSILA